MLSMTLVQLKDTRCLLLHSEVSTAHCVHAEHWTRIGLQSIYDVTNLAHKAPPLKIRLSAMNVKNSRHV